jgi:acetyl esterase/lipase
LVEDAAAAYAFTIARYPAERIVLWGESLGSALALALALAMRRRSHPMAPKGGRAGKCHRATFAWQSVRGG